MLTSDLMTYMPHNSVAGGRFKYLNKKSHYLAKKPTLDLISIGEFAGCPEMVTVESDGESL